MVQRALQFVLGLAQHRFGFLALDQHPGGVPKGFRVLQSNHLGAAVFLVFLTRHRRCGQLEVFVSLQFTAFLPEGIQLVQIDDVVILGQFERRYGGTGQIQRLFFEIQTAVAGARQIDPRAAAATGNIATTFEDQFIIITQCQFLVITDGHFRIGCISLGRFRGIIQSQVRGDRQIAAFEIQIPCASCVEPHI